ncbi:hypothetical protein [Fulvimarina sp. MAC3]|uniref:hypothetical protein n=1 Tax=Fulvimarina sp. MAC3 TaxID=3148887 RepID=UPI0031FE2B7A
MADGAYLERRQRAAILETDACLRDFVVQRLSEGGSPEQIAGWLKGGTGNANGRLRRWLPRSLDLDTLTETDLQDIIVSINTTPRKCLGFTTPLQAMLKELGKDVQIRFS